MCAVNSTCWNLNGFQHKLTRIQRSRVTRKTEMEIKRKNMRNQALQWSQLLRPIIFIYS